MTGWTPWLERFRRGRRADRGPQVQTAVLQDRNPNRYLDPRALARFGLTPLLARRVVEGFISGLHKSPFHGFSVEFADHREYVAGDDLKFLDWYLYARTDHYYVKRYEAETNVRCNILLDRSASMAFGTRGLTKWDYGCFLASCIAHLMLKQQDAVGLGLFGSRPGMLVPPRCRRTHLHQLMQVMIQNPPDGGTDLPGSLRSLVRNIKRRSLVVLISDLIDDPPETLKAIRMIAGRGHDVIVFHVQDPSEKSLDFDGSLLFRDVETGERMEVNTASVRADYQEQVALWMEQFRRGLTEAGIDYQPLETSQPYDKALWWYLQKRAAIRA